MAKYAYMAHDDPAPPVARSTGERMAACGVRRRAGARTSPTAIRRQQSVVNGWLGSPGHRANIENPSFAAIGSGAAPVRTGQVYWAHTFGTTANGCAPAAAAPRLRRPLRRPFRSLPTGPVAARTPPPDPKPPAPRRPVPPVAAAPPRAEDGLGRRSAVIEQADVTPRRAEGG